MPLPEWLAAVPEEEWRHMLEDMPFHLARDGQAERLYELLISHDFLQAKMNVIGLEPLIDDYALARDLGGNAESHTLQQIGSALRAGSVRLIQAPEELWNQVKGRANVALHASHPRPVPRLELRCATLMPADPALLHVLQEHRGDVMACALSADGHMALSASVDGTLYLWKTERGEIVRVLQEQAGTVTACAALSANGQVALSGGQYGMLRLWNTEHGMLRLWNIERETVSMVQGHAAAVTTCALSENGQVALSGDKDGILRLWDTEHGETLQSWSVPFTEVLRCALSKDGKLALSLYSPDITQSFWKARTMRLWDAEHGKLLHSWQFPLIWEVADCALSADGRRVFIASNLLGFRAKLEVLDAATGRRIRKLKGFKGVVASCALSSDGNQALSGSRTAFLGTMIESQSVKSFLLALISAFWVFDNLEGSTLRVWDTRSGKTQRILQGHKDSVAHCALSADGKLALSASSKLVSDNTWLADPYEHWALRLWNLGSKEVSHTQERYAAPVSGCVLSANGHRAITFARGDRSLRFWDTASGQTLHILKHRQAVASCALSADGKLALSVCYDSRLRLWDTESGKMLRSWMYHIIGMKDCALSADGRWALSLRVDGFLYLWDTINGQKLTLFLPEEKPDEGYRRWTFNFAGRGFALSADGCRALFVSKDGGLQIWNRGDNEIPSTLEESLDNVDNWALSADGQRVVAASEDGTLRIWDTESGHVLRTLNGHTNIVPMCALSANGRLALSASFDRTLRLWDTDNGREIMRWTHDTALSSCSLSADGRVAVVGDIEGSVHFLTVVGVARPGDVAAADLPVSWLAEKPQGKHGLLQRLFRKKGAKGEVDTQRSIGRESSSEKASTYRECSFCGKSQDQVQRMIAGPGGAYICDECIDLCREIIEEEDVRRRNLNIGEKKEEAAVPISDKIDENMHINKQTPQHAVPFQKKPEEISEERIKERFDKFTERARKILSLAEEEAQRFQHKYIGTEHLLLGLVREGEGVAAKVLSNLGVELNKIRAAVEFIIGRGDRIVQGEIGLTPRAKKVIDLSVDEARRLNHHYIGSEHLLLGLVREGEGIAAGVLESLGINLEKVRTQTIQVLNQRKIEEEVRASMVEVMVESVRVNEQTQQRIVILRAKEQKAAEKERFLIIWIDHAAAYAIGIALKGTQADPVALLPHDLLKNVIDALDAKIEGVEIWDFQEDVFHGRIVLDAADRHLRLSARPGDAIAVALRVGAPIFVAEQVMKRAGVSPGAPNESSSLDA